MTDDRDFSNYPRSVTEIRAEETKKSSAWSPRDVLIDTLRLIDSGEIRPDALVVVHTTFEGGGRGPTYTEWAVSSPNVPVTLGMLVYAQHKVASK